MTNEHNTIRQGRILTLFKNARVCAEIFLRTPTPENGKRAVKLILSLEPPEKNDREESVFFEVLCHLTNSKFTPAEWIAYFKGLYLNKKAKTTKK